MHPIEATSEQDNQDLEAGQEKQATSSGRTVGAGVLRWPRRLFAGSKQSKCDMDEMLGTDAVPLETSPKGYPMMANFLSSDRSFLQFRGFLDLHCRVLLELQYDVEQLERELNKADKSDEQSSELRLACLSSLRRDRCETLPELETSSSSSDFSVPPRRARSEILADLRTKLGEYNDFLFKTKRMAALQRPSDRDYKSLRYWLYARQPLVEIEAKLFRRREDIVALRTGRESADFDVLVEQCLGILDSFFTKWCRWKVIGSLFRTPELRQKTSKEDVHYYSPVRVDRLVNALITIIIVLLLVVPVVVMWTLSNMDDEATPFKAIAILIVFTVLFGSAMGALTRATRQEIFAASAAYCAVLVVFISNFTVQVVQIAG